MKNEKITIDQLARMMQKGFLGVDKQISDLKTDVNVNLVQLQSRIDRRFEDLDIKFSQNMNTLTVTLERFLKKMTDMEDEFTAMKADIKRMKKIIMDKLGVDFA